jgi:hypothetical protein
MKSKIAVWASLIAGILWVGVGLRDTFAPGFFTMSGSVKSKLDIAMEFATAATFLSIAAVFHLNRKQIDNKTK